MGEARIVWNSGEQKLALQTDVIHRDEPGDLEALEDELGGPVRVITPDGEQHMSDRTAALLEALIQKGADIFPHHDPPQPWEKVIDFP